MKSPYRPMRSSQPTSRVGLSRKPLQKNSAILRSMLSENTIAEVQSSNIRVAVRVRPLNERETTSNPQYKFFDQLETSCSEH